MDKAVLTMIANLEKNTGRSLEKWIVIVKGQNTEKHGEIIKFLKQEHGLTHGYANLIAHKAKDTEAASAGNGEELIGKQYEGKEHFKPMYERLIAEIRTFGKDIDIAPKKSYVSLRRKKQFAILNPATKKRFEIGVNLKGREPEGKLEAEKPNSMCSHKINLTTIEEIDGEVIGWLREAYHEAG